MKNRWNIVRYSYFHFLDQYSSTDFLNYSIYLIDMDEHLYPFSWQSSSRKKTHWWLIKIFCTLYFFVLRIQSLLSFSYTRTYIHFHWLFIIYLLTSTPKSIFISLLTLTSYIHGRIYGPIRTVHCKLENALQSIKEDIPGVPICIRGWISTFLKIRYSKR